MGRKKEDIIRDGEKTQFGKGQDPTKGGRPKKIYSVLKEMGYSKDDVRTAMLELAWYDKSGIKKLIADDKKPAIVLVIARAFERAMAKGDYSAVKEIIDQVIGKPLQKSENDNKHTFGDKKEIESWLDKFSTKIKPEDVEEI